MNLGSCYQVRFATIPTKARLDNPLGTRIGHILRINIQVETNDPEALTVQLCVCRNRTNARSNAVPDRKPLLVGSLLLGSFRNGM